MGSGSLVELPPRLLFRWHNVILLATWIGYTQSLRAIRG
jgi:hypothetical protein